MADLGRPALKNYATSTLFFCEDVTVYMTKVLLKKLYPAIGLLIPGEIVAIHHPNQMNGDLWLIVIQNQYPIMLLNELRYC